MLGSIQFLLTSLKERRGSENNIRCLYNHTVAAFSGVVVVHCGGGGRFGGSIRICFLFRQPCAGPDLADSYIDSGTGPVLASYVICLLPPFRPPLHFTHSLVSNSPPEFLILLAIESPHGFLKLFHAQALSDFTSHV